MREVVDHARPKKTLGDLADGAVGLAPSAKTLGLAEGIESAMSAMQIFADNGEKGREAADRAARHFTSLGQRRLRPAAGQPVRRLE